MLKELKVTIQSPNHERLDKALHKALPHFSRRYLRRLIEQGSVYLNNKRIRKQSKILVPHQEYTVHIYDYDGSDIDALASTIHWEDRILYRDEHLLAVNKPSGIPSAPTRESAVHNVYAYLEKAGILDKKYFPFHRLDKGTTGVLLIPTSRMMIRDLNRQMQETRIQKVYFALVEGTPEKTAWTIDGYMSAPRGYHTPARFSSTERPGFLYSRTDFATELKNPDKNVALVRILPQTGRTHQIRLHLQVSRLSVLGDPIYRLAATQHFKTPHLMLHCFEMRFYHPARREDVAIRAPLPTEFVHLGRLFFPDFDAWHDRLISRPSENRTS
ncbi:MAG: RluA family pseudouridine synthase [Calditrichaeota bacterium]|nr:RluA family pseudouridine synthase [Calditrichota bacterium]